MRALAEAGISPSTHPPAACSCSHFFGNAPCPQARTRLASSATASSSKPTSRATPVNPPSVPPAIPQHHCSLLTILHASTLQKLVETLCVHAANVLKFFTK